MNQIQTEPVTYDYRNMFWGHSIQAWHSKDEGIHVSCFIFGHGFRVGDYILRSHPEGGEARYQIDTLDQKMNPKDMWKVEMTFAPRPIADG